MRAPLSRLLSPLSSFPIYSSGNISYVASHSLSTSTAITREKKINHGMVRRRKTIDIGTLRVIIDRSNTIAVYRTVLASVNRHAVRSAYRLRNRKVSRDPPSFFLSLSSRGAPTISTLMPVSLRLDSTLRSVPLPRPPNTVPLPCHQLRVYPSLSLSLFRTPSSLSLFP